MKNEMGKYRWKRVKIDSLISANDCAFMGLEEITEDVEEVEDVSLSNFIHVDDFKEPLEIKDSQNIDEFKEPERKKAKRIKTSTETGTLNWTDFNLHPTLLECLNHVGFESPTQIQSQTLAEAILKRKDVIGAAETIATLVGGMSIEKQVRLMKLKPDIVVATPGRLTHVLTQIKYLVIDEADRLLEKGHFQDMDTILSMLSIGHIEKKLGISLKRQTFVFSATMSDEQVSYKTKKGKPKTMFDQLISKLEFADPRPTFINLTRKSITAEGIQEAKLQCTLEEKDLIVYYFACRYGGKTIVFVNSIDAIRRLLPILSQVLKNTFGLHAEMEQKQRLKNLERFKEANDAVLIASDVAARGLDIPAVNHIIHYQIPRSVEIYVHRSGRTARANTRGVSLLLVNPNDQSQYKKLLHQMKKQDFVDFPLEKSLYPGLKKRLAIAKEIDKLEHSQRKKENDINWLQKAALEADILLSSEDEDDRQYVKAETQRKVANLKQNLKHLLEQPLIPKKRSFSFVTRHKDMLDNALNSQNHLLPSIKNSTALNDLQEYLDAHKPEQECAE